VSDLAIGSILAYSIEYHGLISWIQRWSKRTLIIGYLIGIGLLFSAHILFTNTLESIERLIIGIFFAFVLMEQIYSNHSFYKIDLWPFFFQLGELTYGFYLFHCVYFYYWSLFFVEHQLTDHFSYFLLYIIVCFASTYCTAWLSLKFIERPILKLKRYFK
jgi:peptidoglycan/LPS O-acetylase OafA/YrhL